MPHILDTENGARVAHHVELSPSPEPPPRLTATAGPSRLTTAVPHTHSLMSADDHAAREGDLYVINAANGDRFHLAVTLQGPYHPLTSVTHDALQRTVRHILLPHPNAGSSGENAGDTSPPSPPPPTLLLDGMPLDESTTAVLPNNAVIVVHRGVSEEELAMWPHRSRTPSQSPAAGAAGGKDGITVVEMMSDSLPPSVTAPSEREMSLHSILRTGTHEAGRQGEHPLTLPTHPRLFSSAGKGPAGQAAKMKSGATPSQRLPPRRGGAAPAVSSGLGGVDTNGGAATATAAAAPSSAAFTRTSHAASPAAHSASKTEEAMLHHVPPRSTSPTSSPSEEEAYVVRTPSVPVPARPLGALQDTGISATTVSPPSSIAPIPSLRSVIDTTAPAEPQIVVARDVLTVDRTPPSARSAPKIKTPASAEVSGTSSPPAWDRRGPPPVSVIVAAPPSPSRASTAFTSPAARQTSPPSAQLHPTFVEAAAPSPRAFAPSPHQHQQQQRPDHQQRKKKPEPSPSSSVRAVPAAPPTPVVSSALFQTPLRTTNTSAWDEGSERARNDRNAPAAAVAREERQEAPPVCTSPLPPHSSLTTTIYGESRLTQRPPAQQALQEAEAEAERAAYDAQRTAIVDAAAAEQQRLLTRLQEHCGRLEKEKKALLAERLRDLRAQESASRLRVLRAAQEDAAAAEIDSVRARLGQHRDALLAYWLRVVHAHSDQQYPLTHEVLQQLEDEGERLTLQCLSAIASYHTQKASLQALRHQRTLKEAEVARLRWEAHVRSCTAEERRGCLRVVARVRPPLRRPWLPDSVLSLPEAREYDRGYAVRVVAGARGGLERSRRVEVVDPARDLRREYTFAAAYGAAAEHDGGLGASQQQLFREQLQPLLEHMCRTGQRVAVLAVGAVGSGKTYTLVGPHVEPPPPPPPAGSAAAKKAKAAEAAAAKERAAATSGAGKHGPSVNPHDRTDNNTSNGSYDSFTASSDSSGEDEDDNRSVQFEEEEKRSRRVSPQGRVVVREAELAGITEVRDGDARRGITRCLDPADAAVEARVLQSVAAAEEEKRRQRSRERHDCEERQWRKEAGIEAEDGLLPRAVAWLAAHLRCNADGSRAGGAPVVESLVFSMYEVYNDHIYDLLPVPPPAPPPPAAAEDGAKAGRVRSDPSTWPRWNAGWLPPPHIKNSNPEKLTELQLELAPPAHHTMDTAVTVSQPQWRVRATEVEVRTAAEALQAIQLGMQRRRSAQTLRSAQSSRSHLFLRFRVEVQRSAGPEKASAAAARCGPAAPLTAGELPAAQGGVFADVPGTVRESSNELARPKGYDFLRASLVPSAERDTAAGAAASLPAPSPPAAPPTCVTELLFTDFAGTERVDLGGTAGDTLREAQYINASLSAVADVLTALAHANPCQENAATKDRTGGSPAGSATAKTTSAADLVERWNAISSRPGVSLTRSTPVFLQPRFTKLVGGRFQAPPPTAARDGEEGGGESGLPLRRRVLALMDTYVAGQEAAQWWRSWRASSTYIPFRACKATQLLQSTLGAPCKSLLLACVRPCTVAEVVLPASMQERKGKRTRELALALFDRQAPMMLAEVYSTLAFADRVNTATSP